MHWLFELHLQQQWIDVFLVARDGTIASPAGSQHIGITLLLVRCLTTANKYSTLLSKFEPRTCPRIFGDEGAPRATV